MPLSSRWSPRQWELSGRDGSSEIAAALSSLWLFLLAYPHSSYAMLLGTAQTRVCVCADLREPFQVQHWLCAICSVQFLLPMEVMLAHCGNNCSSCYFHSFPLRFLSSPCQHLQTMLLTPSLLDSWGLYPYSDAPNICCTPLSIIIITLKQNFSSKAVLNRFQLKLRNVNMWQSYIEHFTPGIC